MLIFNLLLWLNLLGIDHVRYNPLSEITNRSNLDYQVVVLLFGWFGLVWFMVFDATFNIIAVIFCGGQFYWWKKPD